MAFEDLDPTSAFDIETIRRALGGFSESPATARETALRQQSQQQDLALNLVRQMMGIQEEQAGRQAGRESAALREKADIKAEEDPLAAITRALTRGESPESSLIESLRGVVGERFGLRGGAAGGADKTLNRQVLAFIRGTPRRLDQRLSQVKDPGEGAAPEEHNAFLSARREAYLTEIRELISLANQQPESAEAAREAISQIADRARREGIPGIALIGNRLGTRSSPATVGAGVGGSALEGEAAQAGSIFSQLPGGTQQGLSPSIPMDQLLAILQQFQEQQQQGLGQTIGP